MRAVSAQRRRRRRLSTMGIVLFAAGSCAVECDSACISVNLRKSNPPSSFMTHRSRSLPEFVQKVVRRVVSICLSCGCESIVCVSANAHFSMRSAYPLTQASPPAHLEIIMSLARLFVVVCALAITTAVASPWFCHDLNCECLAERGARCGCGCRSLRGGTTTRENVRRVYFFVSFFSPMMRAGVHAARCSQFAGRPSRLSLDARTQQSTVLRS